MKKAAVKKVSAIKKISTIKKASIVKKAPAKAAVKAKPVAKKTKPVAAAKPAAAKPAIKKTIFSLKAEPGCTIYVAGDFNQWDPAANQMNEKANGLYTASVELGKGRYEYKFVINDVWTVDPLCQDWVSNSLGSLNSVIIVE